MGRCVSHWVGGTPLAWDVLVKVYQWSGLGGKAADVKLGSILVLAIGSACMLLGYCIYARIFCGEGLGLP